MYNIPGKYIMLPYFCPFSNNFFFSVVLHVTSAIVQMNTAKLLSNLLDADGITVQASDSEKLSKSIKCEGPYSSLMTS